MRIYSRLAPVHADVQDNNMLRNKYILKNKGKYCLVILMDSHQVQAYIFFLNEGTSIHGQITDVHDGLAS